jgi:hypothetical protein
MGSAVGVAALGALVNGLMRGDTPTQDPEQFGDAVTVAFVAVAVVALATVAAAAAMPRTTVEHDSAGEAATGVRD